MTWLTPDPGEHPAKRLRALLEDGQPLVVPGVVNGLTALLAREAGARALHLSEAAFSASMGMPDVGLVTLDELARAARQIVRVTRLPLFVDAGSGFGDPLMVMRTVRELEGARCAAIHLSGRRRSARRGGSVGRELTRKVAAAAAARQQLVVVARLEADGEGGLDELVRLAFACRDAGADLIEPAGLGSQEELEGFARRVPGPLLSGLADAAPDLTAARLGELGYGVVTFATSAALVAAAQVRTFYGDLLRDGSGSGWTDRMLGRQELSGLLGEDEHIALERGLDAEPGDPP